MMSRKVVAVLTLLLKILILFKNQYKDQENKWGFNAVGELYSLALL
jgi:hypothetical protein